MIDWQALMEVDKKLPDAKTGVPDDDWRKEAAYSLCELYYSQYRSQRSYSANQRIDLRPGSDFHIFMRTHMKPLEQ